MNYYQLKLCGLVHFEILIYPVGAYLLKSLLRVGPYSRGGLFESGSLIDHLRYVQKHQKSATKHYTIANQVMTPCRKQ